MHTRDVPEQQWESFLTEFARRHEGEPVDIETLEAGAGPDSKACDVPLAGIAVSRTAGGGGGGTIAVTVGRSPEERVTHLIPSPLHVLVSEADGGEVMSIVIDCDDGSVTRLRFEPLHAAEPPGQYLG